jgi:hypothetical protein
MTEITIARLYNLGSYEHVRYEIRVAVPDTSDPYTVLENLESAIAALNPKPPHDQWTLNNACKDARDESVSVARQKECREIIQRHDEWLKAKRDAQQKFLNLGGTAKHETVLPEDHNDE